MIVEFNGHTILSLPLERRSSVWTIDVAILDGDNKLVIPRWDESLRNTTYATREAAETAGIEVAKKAITCLLSDNDQRK